VFNALLLAGGIPAAVYTDYADDITGYGNVSDPFGYSVASITFRSDGVLEVTVTDAYGNTTVTYYDWVLPAELTTTPGDYEIALTVNSGTPTDNMTGSGTWEALSSDKYVFVSRNAASGSGSDTANVTIQVRDTSDTEVINFTIDLTATM
jgi:hypothetical protein